MFHQYMLNYEIIMKFSESEDKLKTLQEKIENESFQNTKEKKSKYSVVKDNDQCNDPMQLVSCSTPINKETLHVPNIQLSNIFDSTTTNHIDNDHIVQQISGFTHNNKSLNNSDIQLSTLNNIQHYVTNVNQSTEIVILEKTATKNSIIQNDTSESSIPSGATEILNAIGDDWLISSTENKDDNNCDNVKNNIRDNYDDQGNNNKCDNSNELAKTSDYSLNDNTNSSNKNSTDNTHRTSQPHSMQSNSSMELNSVQIHDVSPLDIRKVQVPYSKDSSLKRTIKKYFCPYCKKLQTKFARHLEI